MGIDAQEVDRRLQEMWRRSAEGWRRRQQSLREKTAPVSAWLVDAIDPKAGERVLELAAGPGETGFIAARRLGREGRLLSTDQAPQMVEIARGRAAELALDNVEFAVLDAQRMELDPGSFDAVLCRWGYMLMVDPDEALRRTRWVLKPGGRLALASWDRPERNLWMAAPALALAARGAMVLPKPREPGPFALADPAEVERRLKAAGFGAVQTDVIEFLQRYPSLDEYWAETMDLSAPVVDAMEGLPSNEVEAVRGAVARTLSPFIGPGGAIEIPARAVVAFAVAAPPIA